MNLKIYIIKMSKESKKIPLAILLYIPRLSTNRNLKVKKRNIQKQFLQYKASLEEI